MLVCLSVFVCHAHKKVIYTIIKNVKNDKIAINDCFIETLLLNVGIDSVFDMI